jgi:hypothetical protein
MESRVSLPCSQEQATNINIGIKNNMSQKPRTEYSPGNISLLQVIWSADYVLDSTAAVHYDVIVTTRFNVNIISRF